MTTEDDISLLKYQLSEMDKRYAGLEQDFKELRQRFSGLNSLAAELKTQAEQLRAKYGEVSEKFDIKMALFDKKLQEILRLTKKNAEAKLERQIPTP